MASAQCQQTAEGWVNKGIDFGNQGKYDEAIKAYDEAIKAFDEAIRLNPNFAHLASTLSACHKIVIL
jgi:tetratricopeptide (TPR) repeat protein